MDTDPVVGPLAEQLLGEIEDSHRRDAVPRCHGRPWRAGEFGA